MKKLLENRYFKMAALGILFLLSSFFTYYGFYLVVPMITSYGRFTLNYLPVVFTFWTFLFSFMMLWLFIHNKNKNNQIIIAKIYGLVVTIIESISLIIHIIMISVQYGWNKVSHVVSPLFPYDVLLLMILFLSIGVFVLVLAFKKQKEIDVKDNNSPQIMKKRTYVGFLVLTPFTNYYLGLLLSSFNVMDSFDQNIYGMIPIIISFVIPYLSIALFFLYQHFFKKYKFQIIALFSLLGFTVIIYTYILIALLINPSLIIESMTNFFVLGYAIKIPLGLYINIVITFTIEIVAAIKFIKKTRKLLYEQKQNENK